MHLYKKCFLLGLLILAGLTKALTVFAHHCFTLSSHVAGKYSTDFISVMVAWCLVAVAQSVPVRQAQLSSKALAPKLIIQLLITLPIAQWYGL